MPTTYVSISGIVNFETFYHSLQNQGTALVPDVSGYYGSSYRDHVIKNQYDLADYLSKETQLSVVPHASSEYPDAIKISNATSSQDLEWLEAALSKLERWFDCYLF